MVVVQPDGKETNSSLIQEQPVQISDQHYSGPSSFNLASGSVPGYAGHGHGHVRVAQNSHSFSLSAVDKDEEAEEDAHESVPDSVPDNQVQCEENETLATGCYHDCQHRCDHTIKDSKDCPKVCDSDKCICKEGFVRNDENQCVKPLDCPNTPSIPSTTVSVGSFIQFSVFRILRRSQRGSERVRKRV